MSIANISLTADSRQVRTATKDLRVLQDQGSSTERAVAGLRNAFIALGGAMAARDLVRYADTYTSIQNQLRIVTKSTSELVDVQSKLLGVANNTRSEFEATTGLYATLARNTTELGLSQGRLVRITDIINKSFAASGASAQEAAGSIRQLSQGLAAGALRGDEFNSVAEGAPEILRAVSAETGKTIGQLREFAAEGGITAELLIRSLENYGETIDDIFDKSERTFGQSLTVANNNITEFIGSLESGAGVIGTFGSAAVTISENLDAIANVAGVIATIFAGRLTASAATSAGAFLTAQIQAARYTATIGALVGMSKTAVVSQTALAAATRGAGAAMAFLGGPVGLVVTALGAAAIAYSSFSDETEDNTEKLKANTDAMSENLTLLERYREGRDKAIEASVSGGSSSQIQAELDATLNTINALQSRLERLNERGASAARIADVSEKLREQKVEADALREALKKANAQEDITGKAQAAEAYEKITQRINDEILALREGGQVAEIRIAQRRAGVDATDEEGKAIAKLIKERDRLEEAERRSAEALREEERAYAAFTSKLEKAADAEADAAKAKKENFDSLKQSIILQRDQIALDSEQFELRRNLMALGDDATPDQISQITQLTTQMQALRFEAELLGPSLQSSFADIGLNAISSFSDELANSILLGESLEDSLRNIGQTVVTGLLSAVIEYGTRQAAMYALDAAGFTAAETAKTAAVTAGVATQTAAATTAIGTLTAAQAASGATIASSMAPAAAATSIATAGAAPAAAAPIALSSIGAIMAALVGGMALGGVMGGRRQGGQMLGGNQYMVGEQGPEVVTMGGRANVTPFNQLMQQAGQGGTTNNSESTQANITFTMPEGNSDFRNRVAQNRDLIYNVVQQALNDRGQRLGGRK
ncbi:MAG: tape measure protein [Marinomonas gallaica]